jgi:murein DD-endopeptidase MepM/ murein hydrolase activator NlpD
MVARPAPGPITGAFHERRRGRAHQGVDIDGETGDPVRAAAAGVVLASGTGVKGFSGYGTIVIVAHVEGMTTLYAHLSRVSVLAGQPVRAGDIVGAMGCTGSCSGSHLHFEVRLDNVPVDPARFMLSGSTP